jgi:hypothetical protein
MERTMTESTQTTRHNVTLELLKPQVVGLDPNSGYKVARYEIKVRASAKRTVRIIEHSGWEQDSGRDTLVFKNTDYNPAFLAANGENGWTWNWAYGKLDGDTDPDVELYHRAAFTVSGPDGIPSDEITITSPVLTAQVD